MGGFTFQADGSLLLFMAHGKIAVLSNGRLHPVRESLPGEEEARFNDVIADPGGARLLRDDALRPQPARRPLPPRPRRHYREGGRGDQHLQRPGASRPRSTASTTSIRRRSASTCSTTTAPPAPSPTAASSPTPPATTATPTALTVDADGPRLVRALERLVVHPLRRRRTGGASASTSPRARSPAWRSAAPTTRRCTSPPPRAPRTPKRQRPGGRAPVRAGGGREGAPRVPLAHLALILP